MKHSEGMAERENHWETDEVLVHRVRDGDDRAMEELYARHSRVLYGLTRRMTGREDDAQDILQESFLRAWRSIGRFRGDTSFRNWIIGIGVNCCRDLRRRKTKPSEIDFFEDIQNASDGIDRRWLNDALCLLPEGYREVLILHDVLEMKHREIADALGTSVGNSKSQLHKARAQMRALLRETLDEAEQSASRAAGSEEQ